MKLDKIIDVLDRMRDIIGDDAEVDIIIKEEDFSETIYRIDNIGINSDDIICIRTKFVRGE